MKGSGEAGALHLCADADCIGAMHSTEPHDHGIRRFQKRGDHRRRGQPPRLGTASAKEVLNLPDKTAPAPQIVVLS